MAGFELLLAYAATHHFHADKAWRCMSIRCDRSLCMDRSLVADIVPDKMHHACKDARLRDRPGAFLGENCVIGYHYAHTVPQ
jgi:hypothetical protein